MHYLPYRRTGLVRRLKNSSFATYSSPVKAIPALLLLCAISALPSRAQDLVPPATPEPSPASIPTAPPPPGPAPSPAPAAPEQTPAATANAAPTPSIFQMYAPYLVIIEGDKGAGSGFLAAYEGGLYVFTNTHVLSGNSKFSVRLLKGTPITTNGLSVADAYDISALPQTTVTTGGVEILKDIDKNVAIGDDVVVLGNSLGAAVVTEITGKVTGIGPELVEVDAKFVAGNSGSPIIHVKTGKAIAIATFTMIRKMENFGKDSQFNSVERRFGYRLDNISGWRNMTWPTFTREAAVVNAIAKRTEDIWNLAADISEHNAIKEWGTHTQRGNSLASMVTEYRQIITAPNLGQSGATDAKRKLLFWISREVKKDFPVQNVASFSAYSKKLIEEQKEHRDVLAKFFEQLEATIKQ